MLSIATDFLSDRGSPEKSLRAIADAGFSYIHWCHHWRDDFYYDASEVAQLQQWLSSYRLKIYDVHGSCGVEKNWASCREYERLAGVALTKNRLDFAAKYGGRAVVMHAGVFADGKVSAPAYDQLRHSLDELMVYSRQVGVPIALENGWEDDYAFLDELLSAYPPEYVGFCFDSGHANLGTKAGTPPQSLADRLLVVHLHDNDGQHDQHKMPLTGIIDWPKVMTWIHTSPYDGCLTMEASFASSGMTDEMDFLHAAYASGEKLINFLAAADN